MPRHLKHPASFHFLSPSPPSSTPMKKTQKDIRLYARNIYLSFFSSFLPFQNPPFLPPSSVQIISHFCLPSPPLVLLVPLQLLLFPFSPAAKTNSSSLPPKSENCVQITTTSLCPLCCCLEREEREGGGAGGPTDSFFCDCLVSCLWQSCCSAPTIIMGYWTSCVWERGEGKEVM